MANLNSLVFPLIGLLTLQATHSTQETAKYRPMSTWEWSERHQCNRNLTDNTQENCQRSKPDQVKDYCSKEPDACKRNSADWMWKYVDEMRPKFKVLIRENSTDERLANILYATVGTRGFDKQLYLVNPKDDKMREEFDELITGPEVNHTICGQHLREVLYLLEKRARSSSEPMEESQIRLAHVLDSFGRYESAFLSGKSHAYGSFEQCVHSQLLFASSTDLVKMRYCWAKVSLESNLSPELKRRNRWPHERGHTSISIGVCLPISCHSKSFHYHPDLVQELLNTQFKFPLSIYNEEHQNITSLDCLPDGPPAIPLIGRLILTATLAWLCLIMYATIYTWRRARQASELCLADSGHPNEPPSWLNCVSLTYNWSDLVGAEDANKKVNQAANYSYQRVDFDTINPVKVIVMFVFFLAHVLITQYSPSNQLLRDYAFIDADPVASFIVTLPIVVETFFVITGALLTYSTLKSISQRRNRDHKERSSPSTSSSSLRMPRFSSKLLRFATDCFKFIIKRYLRLLPLFYFVFAFKKSVLIYLGYGPMWDYGFNRDTNGQCQYESWWSPMLFTSARDPIATKCIPQSYTISCDLFFAILMAPLVHLIKEWPKTIISLSCVISFVSNLMGLIEFDKIDTTITWGISDLRFYSFMQIFTKDLSVIYTSPDYRMASILLGMIAGYLIYKYDQAPNLFKANYWNSSTHLMGMATFSSFAIIIFILVSGAFREQMRTLSDPEHRRFVAHYVVTIRLLWAMSSSVIILRLLTDWADHRWLAWTRGNFWRFMSKLNYGIFLVHLHILLLHPQLMTTETIMSRYNLMSNFTFAYSSSIIIAIILYLLIEKPSANLIKRYII